MSAEKQYKIPENYLPGGYRCITVLVPDDPLYIGTFWQSYEFLCTWLAWERDALKRGKQVAYKWRVGFDKARAEFELYGGCMPNVTGIRQNPSNPCELQLSFDGGSSWSTFADVSECIPTGSGNVRDITIENNVIVGRDQCGDTVPLGPAFDPTTSAQYKPTYDPSIPGENCVAGANAAKVFEDRLHEWANIRLTVIGIVQQAIDIATALIAIFPEAAWTLVFWEAYEETANWSETWWTDISTIDVYDQLRVMIAKYYNRDGTMTKVNADAMIAEFLTNSDGPPTTTSTSAAWFILAMIARGLGPVGMNRISTAAGILTADCSDVEWEQVFDLAMSSNGWLGDNGCQWITGVGFVDKLSLITGTDWRSVGVERTIPSTTITMFRAEYSCELGTTTESDGQRGQLFFNGEENPTLIEQDSNAEGDVVLTWQGSTAGVTFLNATKNVSAVASPGDGGGSATMKRVTVRGIGVNPFV